MRERLPCVCVCPRPCVTLLPLMSPFTLQPNLLNSTHTSTGTLGLEMLRAIHRLYPPQHTHSHTPRFIHTDTHIFLKPCSDNLTHIPIIIMPPHTSIPPQCVSGCCSVILKIFTLYFYHYVLTASFTIYIYTLVGKNAWRCMDLY